MNFLDKIFLAVSPGYGAKRVKSRLFAEQMLGYDAAKPGRTRKMTIDNRSGNSKLYGAAQSLRGQARYLDDNHDLVTGLFDTLEQKVVGPRGISVEPMPMTVAGEKHDDLAKKISALFDVWSIAPDTTGECSRAEMERLSCRSWLRDGEMFGKFVEGVIANFKHNTDIPLSIELLEADFLPFDSDGQRVEQGIERNNWGQPLRYHFYKFHPGDNGSFDTQTIPVSADRVIHLKHTKRIRQGRGVTILHAVLTRLEDLKDYEESERVAARISAVLAAYIKRTDEYSGKAGDDESVFQMAPGMFFDGLQPGEDIGTVESNRPSTLLPPYRDSMLTAVGRGTRVTRSNITGNFDGTYSSQRQEMVEGYAGYEVLQQMFINKWSRRVYRRFIDMAVASGLLEVPADIEISTLYNAMYIAPVMPWIDPDKESKAHERNVKAGFDTEANVIRSRGKSPQDTKQQRAQEVKENKEKDLVFSSDARHEVQTTTETPEGESDATE